MPRYFTFIRGAENQGKAPAAFEKAMQDFIGQWLANGTLAQTAGLARSKDGTRIRIANGKLVLTDGPFAEAKEVIGGYAIIEASTREKAIEAVRAFMQLHIDEWPGWEGECEIRAMDFVAP